MKPLGESASMDRQGFLTRSSIERWLTKTAGAAALLAAMMGEAPAQELKPAMIAPASYNAAAVCPLCRRRGGCDCYPIAPTPPPVTGKVGDMEGDMGSADNGMGNPIEDRIVDQYDTQSPVQNYTNYDTVANTSQPLSQTMVGDLFGSGAAFPLYDYYDDIVGYSTVPVGAGDRIFKPSENSSPVPQTRFFFSYHHFDNALQPTNIDGVQRFMDVNRFVFGFEKANADRTASIEFRAPFAAGMAPDQVYGVPSAGSAFGNITVTPKVVLYQNSSTLYSLGLGVSLPTANDATLWFNGSPLVRYNNDSVHLIPFLGMYHHDAESAWYTISYLSLDCDVNGSRVDTVYDGTSGVYQDQTVMHADFALLCDLYVNPNASFLTRVTPLIELHYTTALQDSDVVYDSVMEEVVTNPFGRYDVLNLTAGTHVMLGAHSTVTFAAVTKLVDDNWEVPMFNTRGDFPDVELALQYNFRF